MCSVANTLVSALFLFADSLACCGCRLLQLAHAEHTNCAAHNDIEDARRPKMYVLVKEVTKEVRLT